MRQWLNVRIQWWDWTWRDLGDLAVLLVLACLLFLQGTSQAFAQEGFAEPFDAPFPQSAYVLPDPITHGPLLLVAPSGRWTVQAQPEDCVAPYTQLQLTAPVDDPAAMLVLED